MSGPAKAWVKRRLGAAFAPRWARRAGALAIRQSVKIVLGHYFGRPRPYIYHQGGTTIEDLRAKLSILAEHFEFVALDRLIIEARQAAAPCPNLLAVTLDDGFDILSEGAYDVFEEFKVPVTTFVVVGCIDNRNLIWANKVRAAEMATPPGKFRSALRELNESNGLATSLLEAPSLHVADLGWPMERKDELADRLWQACGMAPLDEYLDLHRPFHTLAQLRDLRRRGHAVGLHTQTHPYCDRLNDADLEKEFIRPAAWLRQELGLATVPMAYPFGVRLAKPQEKRLGAAGVISCALGVDGFSSHPSDPLRLERASLEGDMIYNVFAAPLVRKLQGGRSASGSAAHGAQ